jgi:Fe(3+) dicitrate transport protein
MKNPFISICLSALLSLHFFPSISAESQDISTNRSGILHGLVKDENNNALPHVHIGLVGTRYGTVTNDEGTFQLENLPGGLFILGITMVGYEDYREEIRIKPGEMLTREIILNPRSYQIETVSVLADRLGIFEKVPGALSYINREQIQQLDPVSGNEVFRRSPGLHVVDEEGVGLRTNIGIRGLDPDRSRSVLIMEDGIPVSLAPYGEPEMYYTPAMDRMAGVEILKGSGSILYGPQTIGGVINYITADPPLNQAGSVMIRGSEGGFFTGKFSFGNTHEQTGYQMNYLRKQADSVGVSNYTINDLTTRLRFQMGDQSSLTMKLAVYDESSNATYVGITQSMFDAGGSFDYARIAPDDRLHIRRYSASLAHNHFFNHLTRITTTAFGYTTSRNWQRQDFAYNSFNALGSLSPKPSNYSGIMWGDESVPGGAIYMRNSTGNRNRQFEVAGIESRLHTSWQLGKHTNQLTTGARIMYERAYEQRINGSHGKASSGNIQEDEIRTGYGISSYIHNQIELTSLFSVTAGLRAEQFSYERDIRRGRFNIGGQSVTRDTLLTAGSSLTALIPGAGFNLSVGSMASLFGGLHRGFAPPRVKDAVSNQGYVYHLEEEKSWNYELGIRQKATSGFFYELTAFYMDFSNQVIPVAESSGGLGAGAGLINGGATLHQGLEGAFVLTITDWLQSSRISIEWDGRATFVDSRFSSERYVSQGSDQVNIKGNKTPYAPSLFAGSSLTIKHQTGLMACVNMNYTGKQFTDVLNTTQGSADGRTGVISPFTIWDANLAWTSSKWGTTFNISARNITNERYIVTRRPQGIRLGLPRMITAGFQIDF